MMDNGQLLVRKTKEFVYFLVWKVTNFIFSSGFKVFYLGTINLEHCWKLTIQGVNLLLLFY